MREERGRLVQRSSVVKVKLEQGANTGRAGRKAWLNRQPASLNQTRLILPRLPSYKALYHSTLLTKD
jgi:hypothetical protein